MKTYLRLVLLFISSSVFSQEITPNVEVTICLSSPFKKLTESISFKKNSVELKKDFFEELKEIKTVIEKIHSEENIVFKISSFPGEGEEGNEKLSLNRAEKIKFLLVEMGVEEDILMVHGYEKLMPIDANDKSNRIEIDLIAKD